MQRAGVGLVTLREQAPPYCHLVAFRNRQLSNIFKQVCRAGSDVGGYDGGEGGGGGIRALGDTARLYGEEG